MIALGTTLRCNLPPRHIWVVITDPARTGGPILMVNLTSFDADCIDDVCILDASDFPLLSHKTTVAYSRALSGDATKLASLIQDGSFAVISDVSAATLGKILAGAQTTAELSEAKRALVG